LLLYINHTDPIRLTSDDAGGVNQRRWKCSGVIQKGS
jgi:hypothetical protein